MKRNFADSLSRSTAGSLPVPLFNQKKRNRQPLTSNPLQNEPSTGHSADNFDFSAMLADFGWETAKPESVQLQRTGGARQEEKSIGSNLWKKQDFPAFGWGRENVTASQLKDRPDCFVGAAPQKTAGQPRVVQSKALLEEQSHATAAQRPAALSDTPRGPQRPSASYAFRQNPCQPKAHEKTAALLDGKTTQKVLASRDKLREKIDTSLRMISAVIESMKHWSQHADKTPLLFEVLGVLDSAVTPGSYGAKTFLLRDGKESVSCVFYEIDRELPRLIRGQVHRCVGNYDAKRAVFKCVSVRPATVPERQTFQDFVQIADAEMDRYVKKSHEA
ncbi:hypothetical protein JRQ81_008074 [Phrynocephalus forsythii]|uniref:Spermatogenesis-associated protein 22 n=1 Tax=Phrynocephalus forsythii TaxID=171643 RepID=A0A9Q0XD52_9SAUR|nr:hypothetical protein JRQ81_008074 [Phrynocephalus forsythii]